jgi:small subunit ribosomal protein S16
LQIAKGRKEMVKIRLHRVGTKKKPVYRVVVADSRAPRDGAFIEIIGHFDPRTEPPTINFKQEKTLEWLNRGAKPTPTVASLLIKSGISHKMATISLRKPTYDRKPKKKEAEEKPAEKTAPAATKPAPAAEAKPEKS